MDYSVEELWGMISSVVDTPKIDRLQWNPLNETEFKTMLFKVFTDDDDGYDVNYLIMLRRHIVMVCELEGKDFIPYYRILETITRYKEATTRLKPIEIAESDWIEVINGALLRVQQLKQIPEKTVLSLQSRPLYVIKSAMRLKDEFGILLQVKEGRILITDEDIKKVANSIEECIIDCGARNVFNVIMSHYSSAYNPVQNRYHSPRSPHMTSEPIIPSPPFGYLIQLALKHWGTKPVLKYNQEASWKKALRLAFNLISVEDCEQHSSFEIMLSSPQQLTRLLEDLAVFDTVCHFPQMNPAYLQMFLSEPFKWVDQTLIEATHSFSLNDVQLLVSYIRNLTMTNPHRSYIIDRDDLLSTIRELSSDKVDAMLTFFTHQVGSVNSDYLVPRDHERIDSWFKPLFSDEDGRIWLPNATINLIGFYESAYEAVRKCYSTDECENEMGSAVEQMLRTIITSRDTEVFYGDYQQNGVRSDIDCAIMDERTIILFEVKKKALTRAARSGVAFNLLLDLGLSNGKALSQLYKHEAVMKRDGYIEVCNSEGNHRITYNNRRIIKVVATFLDYGSLSDRNVLQHFLSTLNSCTFHVQEDSDKADGVKIDKVNKIGHELSKWIKVIYTTKYDSSDVLRNWSLSFPYIILAGFDRDNESLIDSILCTQSVSMSTCDIFRERAEIKRIRKLSAKRE